MKSHRQSPALYLVVAPMLFFTISVISVIFSCGVNVLADNDSDQNDSSKQGLSAVEFQALHTALKPKANEAWRSIPWKISLLDAQRVAAETQKPIFIWAMDGHPLGCT